jgi:hypothetical protein
MLLLKAINSRIQNFSGLMKRAENHSLPENSTMNESDVVWNVEALLNSRYGWADKPFSSQIAQKDVVIIPRNADGSIDVAALPAAIEQARLKIAARYDAVSGNKHIIAIDIEPKTIESGNLGLEITSLIGEDEEIPTTLTMSPLQFMSSKFGDSQDLLPCESFPKAEPPLASAVNNRLSLPASQRMFVSSTQIVAVDGGDALWVNPNNNPTFKNRAHYVFYTSSLSAPNNFGIGCFSTDDMDYFFNSFRDIILPGVRPNGRVLVTGTLGARQLVRHWYSFHEWRLTFGELATCSYIPCYPNGNSSCISCND